MTVASVTSGMSKEIAVVFVRWVGVVVLVGGGVGRGGRWSVVRFVGGFLGGRERVRGVSC